VEADRFGSVFSGRWQSGSGSGDIFGPGGARFEGKWLELLPQSGSGVYVDSIANRYEPSEEWGPWVEGRAMGAIRNDLGFGVRFEVSLNGCLRLLNGWLCRLNGCFYLCLLAYRLTLR